MNERLRMIEAAAMAFCACLAIGCDAEKSSQGDSASYDMTLRMPGTTPSVSA